VTRTRYCVGGLFRPGTMIYGRGSRFKAVKISGAFIAIREIMAYITA
jgi:hypothetical protein